MCINKMILTPTMNFDSEVLSNGRLALTIARKMRVFSLAAAASWFGGIIFFLPGAELVLGV
jgi:hypothetical protein